MGTTTVNIGFVVVIRAFVSYLSATKIDRLEQHERTAAPDTEPAIP